MDALAALIERVEGVQPDAELLWNDFGPLIAAALPYKGDDYLETLNLHMWLWFAIYGVENALSKAVAFTEALLPEAKKLIREEAKDWVTTHWRAVLELPKPPYTMVGDAPTPALALVIATLRAHAAKETT